MDVVTRHPGPFCDDDGDWWVPVGAVPWSEARGLVEDCLSYSIPDDGTLRYVGKEVTTLCTTAEHEVGPDCDGECHLRVLAYHWEENRRW